MRRHETLEEENAEEHINLTPLIDVALVVLIIFVVIAPLLNVDKISLASAGSKVEKEMVSSDNKNRICLRVYPDNHVTLNEKEIALSHLQTELQKIVEKFPNLLAKEYAPLLLQDKRSHFGVYQEIKNQLETLGFEQIDIVLLPAEGQP